MQRSFLFILLLHLLQDTRGYFSTVECPPYSPSDLLHFNDFGPGPLDCTLVMTCTDPFSGISTVPPPGSQYCPEDRFHDDNFHFNCFPEDSDQCEMKFKVTLIKNWDLQSFHTSPCPSVQDSLASLMPVPGNCSLFYKCDWGAAILFECPSELHFNPHLQVCDWPWQAHCDAPWSECPRPYPHCPEDHPHPIYLPHPHHCEHFYQCEWGTPRLQSCPTGLHFNPALKICDWPYKANCRTC